MMDSVTIASESEFSDEEDQSLLVGDGCGNCIRKLLVKTPLVPLCYTLCMCLVYFKFGVETERVVIRRDVDRVVDEMCFSYLLLSPANSHRFVYNAIQGTRKNETNVLSSNSEVVQREFFGVIWDMLLICPLTSVCVLLMYRLIGLRPPSVNRMLTELLVLSLSIVAAELTFIQIIASEKVLLDKNLILHELALALQQRLY
jgi:hypothetical protein